MKTLLTAVLASTLTLTGFSAFAGDNGNVCVTQDAHGNTRVLYGPTNSETVSVALFSHGRGMSQNRQEMRNGREASQEHSTHQYGESILRY